jgi:hypothetical protein
LRELNKKRKEMSESSTKNYKGEIVTRYGGNNVKFESESIGNGGKSRWQTSLFIKGKCVFQRENWGNKKTAENEMARQFLEFGREDIPEVEEVDKWGAQERLNKELANHITALYGQIGILTELVKKKT